MGITIHSLQHQVAIDRDQIAYKKLFIHFHAELVRFAISYVKQKEVAEEVVSDVMMKIWNMEADLMRIENLKVYLFVATKNTALNYLAKNKLPFTDMEDVHEVSINWLDPEKLSISKETANAIKIAIDNLPPKCKLAYTLIREYGHTYKEAAELMGISENTIDRHLQIAMQRLGTALKSFV